MFVQSHSRRQLSKLFIAGVSLLSAGSAHATQGAEAPRGTDPSSSVSGVTVTAPAKLNPLVSPGSQFVRTHIPEGMSDQLARFRDDVCVSVQGLPAEFDAFIAKRVIEVAAQVRAPVAKTANCTPNVHVIFTAQPQAQLDDIAKRKDILIGYHFSAQLKHMTTVNRPVQAWYVTRTRDTSGNSWLEVANPCGASPPGPPRGNCGDRPVGRAGSRLGNDMSAEVVHALILVDANKVTDAKIGSVADYIAVLALAKWQGLERCNAIPTILNLMADSCEGDAPEAVTHADLALLEGLYSVDARELGSQQRAAIAERMSAASVVASTQRK